MIALEPRQEIIKFFYYDGGRLSGLASTFDLAYVVCLKHPKPNGKHKLPFFKGFKRRQVRKFHDRVIALDVSRVKIVDRVAFEQSIVGALTVNHNWKI